MDYKSASVNGQQPLLSSALRSNAPVSSGYSDVTLGVAPSHLAAAPRPVATGRATYSAGGRRGSRTNSDVGSVGSLQSDFAISDYKGHVTLKQAKWLFEAEVREEENRPCCQVYKVLWIVFFLVATAVALGLTVFHEQLSPHYMKILELGSIPFVSVVFTYLHIWLALWMTFYPLEFFGCWKPYIGWQGIVPSKAGVMAEKAVDLMTTRLIKVEDVFGRLDPARVVQELEPALNSMLGEMMEAIALAQYPGFWTSLPDSVKRESIRKAAEDAPATIKAMMTDIKNNIATVFDLKHMVVHAFTSDKALLNYMFLKCGEKELNYIKVLGAYIGFILGSLQMTVFIFYRGIWILPLTGLIAGTFTNWLAIKMIFEPVKPYKLFGGCCTFQGLFLKRQMEVAAEYATLCTTHVLNAKYLLNALLRGPSADKLFDIIFKHVRAGIDSYAGNTRVLINLVVGGEAYQRTKSAACDHILKFLPKYLTHLEKYTDSVMDVENLLFDKMSVLPPEEFEALLHPIFEEDEWKLVLLGGVLGVAVGTIQAFAFQ